MRSPLHRGTHHSRLNRSSSPPPRSHIGRRRTPRRPGEPRSPPSCQRPASTASESAVHSSSHRLLYQSWMHRFPVPTLWIVTPGPYCRPELLPDVRIIQALARHGARLLHVRAVQSGGGMSLPIARRLRRRMFCPDPVNGMYLLGNGEVVIREPTNSQVVDQPGEVTGWFHERDPGSSAGGGCGEHYR